MERIQRLWLAMLLVAVPGAPTLADVTMPAIFGNHMVLQRGVKSPVWGTAEPGEKVTVSFAGQEVATEADEDGKWMATLTPMAASIRPRTLTVTGENPLRFEDVLVGDVWICSGQSNMQWAAWTGYGIPDGAKEIEAAEYPRIRMITIPRVTAETPQHTFDGKLTKEDFDGRWAACTPEVMRQFSAVGYFFGRELHQRLDVPIGLVGHYWSGTPAQSWTSGEMIEFDEQLRSYLTKWAEYTAIYPERMAKYEAKLTAAKARGKTLSAWSDPCPQNPATGPGRPGSLYNGMIAPLIPLAIRGVIWYQGESNAGSAEEASLYHRLFWAMIFDWRMHWGQGDFPFLFVQLCTIGKRQTQPVEPSSVALLRESQLKGLALRNTGMAVIIDTDETGNLHPPDKKPVGQRLALAAMKIAYGKDVPFSGPVFDSIEIHDGRAVLRFKHVGNGLVSTSEEGVKGFAVAGKDRKFYWADAKIVGDQVKLSSPEVKEPVAVRYGWANNPETSLYNKAGLPATPFRTDTWELEAVKGKRMKPKSLAKNRVAIPAPAWDAVFERQKGWTGADIANSVDLGDGRTLWLFGDSWIGHVAEGKHGPGSHMVNNSIGIQRTPSRADLDAIRPTPVRFYWGPPDAEGRATAWIVPSTEEASAGDDSPNQDSPEKTSWFWLTGDGIVVPRVAKAGSVSGGKRLVLFLVEIARRGGDLGAFDFKSVGGALAIIDNPRDPVEQWNIRLHPNPHAVGVDEASETPGLKETSWGIAMHIEPDASHGGSSGRLYLFGVRQTAPMNKQLLLARVPLDAPQRFDAWRFYAGGSDWSPRLSDAKAVADHVADELSVDRLQVGGEDVFVMVHSGEGFTKRILLRTAQRLKGPWSAPLEIYTAPRVSRHPTYFAYAAKAHPHLSADGELLVSYLVNSTDMWTMAVDAEIYRPRFIRVRLDRLQEGLGARD